MKISDTMKRYGIIALPVLLVVLMVLLKTLASGHFRNDAAKWAAPSMEQTNIITLDQLSNSENPLLISLDGNREITGGNLRTLHIPAGSILQKENLKKLQKYKGSILLVSDDPAVSARIWMLLSQMGITRLYILTDSTDGEVFKYKFRPDSLTGPEL